MIRKVQIFTAILLLIAIIKVNSDPALEIVRAREIVMWINANITYVPSRDVIKFPAETLMTGGDCADFCSLMIMLLDSEGIRAEMKVLDLDDYEAHHAVVSLLGFIYDPVTGKEYIGEFPLAHTVVFSATFENILFAKEKK